VILLTGPRALKHWQGADTTLMDFYDLKGVVDGMLNALHLEGISYTPGEHRSMHPGKCARVTAGSRQLGLIGELHPVVVEQYELPDSAVLIGEFDLGAIAQAIPDRYETGSVPAYPPVLEDIAVVVDEQLPTNQVEQVILTAGGSTLVDVRLFDVYQGEQVGPGKKSLAYNLTFLDPDRTLTDKAVSKLRERIIRSLEKELGAELRR
jgi:phenylalanyl-tRNA synthetase beta chain